MEFNGCYDSVMDIVARASGKFGSRYKINNEQYDKLTDVCKLADGLIREINCESYEVSVDELKCSLYIEIVGDEIVLDYKTNKDIFLLIGLTNSFVMSKGKGNKLKLCLKLDRLWVRANG